MLRVEVKKDQYITKEEEIKTTDPEATDKTFILAAAPKPVADFTILSSDSTTEGDLIRFDASALAGANGEELTYSWNFGDGSQGGQKQIGHIYMQQGNYAVKLTVAGNYSARTTITKAFQVTATTASSGTAAILGQVTDSQGKPLSEAKVTVKDMDNVFFTDANGEVGINDFPRGKPQMLEISKPGYITEHYKLSIRENEK